jgi:hypothetical protein
VKSGSRTERRWQSRHRVQLHAISLRRAKYEATQSALPGDQDNRAHMK